MDTVESRPPDARRGPKQSWRRLSNGNAVLTASKLEHHVACRSPMCNEGLAVRHEDGTVSAADATELHRKASGEARATREGGREDPVDASGEGRGRRRNAPSRGVAERRPLCLEMLRGDGLHREDWEASVGLRRHGESR